MSNRRFANLESNYTTRQQPEAEPSDDGPLLIPSPLSGSEPEAHIPRARGQRKPVPTATDDGPLLAPGFLTEEKSLELEDCWKDEVPNADDVLNTAERPKNKTEIITLTYPIDIKNLYGQTTTVNDEYGRYTQTTYNVTCFSSIQFQMNQVNKQNAKLYGKSYNFKTYWYRAVPVLKGTVVNRIKLTHKVDHYRKFVHVNVELLE